MNSFSIRRYLPLALVIAILSPLGARPADAITLSPALVRRWAQDDAAIADGEERRTWTWGPRVVRSGKEPYFQSGDGRREVWYLDKARMEISRPEADPDDEWYVSSGLLVRELISGKMQMGDSEYETWQPAQVPVVGDLEAAPETTITYADLNPLAAIDGERRAPAADAGAAPIIDSLSPGGMVAKDERLVEHDVRIGGYDDVLGHNIAAIFLEALPAEQLRYIAGRPLTEPYWARVPVAREPRDVLLQAFERRVLTYTPANPPEWQVEWGNVGRQYAQWRYGQVEDETQFDPFAAVSATQNLRELRELAPDAARIARNRKGLVGVAVYQMDTGAFYSFQGQRAFPMYSTAKVPIMLAVLDLAVREERRVSEWERDLIKVMIQVSDNGAASRLLAHAGGADAVTRYLRRIGIGNTTINGYAWGASTTTAQDMARLMAKIGNCTILVPRLCNYAVQTLAGVVASQKWGVSAGAPSGATVALKNGWYPQNNGWAVNSAGMVISRGKRYAIAVYTNPDPSMKYGIETIEQISTMIYPAVP